VSARLFAAREPDAAATQANHPMKARRQSVVLEVIRREPLRTAGFDVTQATLSRDIRELGLVKGGPDGAYSASPSQAPGDRARSLLTRALTDYLTRVDRVQQLVLLRTGPGQAQLLGVAIDGAALPEVVGTVAGDDTILAVTPDARRARALVKKLLQRRIDDR
jgi:transcriptional regulator of arginine metabolism